MSNNQVSPFAGINLPTGLLSQELLKLNKDVAGGIGGSTNRISIKGNRFRLNVAGQEKILEQTTMDAVIVSAVPFISRVFFKGKYNGEDNVKPTCKSRDGIKPDVDVAEADKQSALCSTCHNNKIGSGTDGKGRACAFKKRVVLVNPEDLQPGVTPVAYAFDMNSMTIFGEDDAANQKYSFTSFVKLLQAPRPGLPNGIPIQAIPIKFSFDPNQSVPKLWLSPSAGGKGYGSFLNDTQIAQVVDFAKSQDVTRLLNEELADAATDTTTAPAAAAPALAAPVKKTWQQIGLDAGLDADDIEIVESAGGPFTEAGAKRWAKLKGPSLGNEATAASAPAPAPTPPPPPKNRAWKEVAAEVGMDADDIEVLEGLGGPSTEKGLKFWNKNGGTNLAEVDTSVAKASKGGRPPKNTTKETPAATTTPESPADPVTASAGSRLASALTSFDDEA